MPSRAFTEADLQAVRDFAKQWGKIIVRRSFGEQGPDLQVNFATLEALAWAACQGLLEGTLEHGLEQQAQRLGDQQPCPECATVCPVEREPHTLVVQGGGTVTQEEPACFCPSCRRSFFPSATAVGARPSRLQSERA